MARVRQKRKREPRDLRGPEKQALINRMTNYWRCRWARSGYPDSIEMLEIFAYPFGKPQQERS